MSTKARVSPAIPPDGIKRVVIKNVRPAVDGGQYPAKGAEGFLQYFKANIIADGHDKLYARVLLKIPGSKAWQAIPMTLVHNDLWQASYKPEITGLVEFRIQAWISELDSWRDATEKKRQAGIDTTLEERRGFMLLQHQLKLASKAEEKTLKGFLDSREGILPSDIPGELYNCLLLLVPKERISVTDSYFIDIERTRAQFSTWYELFPRSCAAAPDQHGTFADVARQLPYLAAAGFDVLYLPPIHPIGRQKRKGKNNSLIAGESDPGSPWAIGSEEGGHKSIHPQLGNMADFKNLVREAKRQGIDIAMDIAFQCAPDHPYVQQHPEWFRWRPNGTVQFAENPPKKYEDILPFDFESTEWPALWEELLSIFLFWIGKGVTIFRVDNPHTKSLRLWEWLISSVRAEFPEVIFLAEAFTRPHIMEHLAMAGFTQSYTYFTWRNSKQELQQYLTELTKGPQQYFFRPNFWPNTPDILPEHLVTGGDNMHVIRLLLAATLSSSYGIYGPVFERGINKLMPGKEEYSDNEKYEIRHWDTLPDTAISRAIVKINHIRKRFRALQQTNNIEFLDTSNEQIMAYVKYSEEDGEHLLIVISLDPHHAQSAWIHTPRARLTGDRGDILYLSDELNQEHYQWDQDWNYVALEPGFKPAHIFSIANQPTQS
ncbi:alpha-1,4-glucan--maltose-1-phosphate maltosyltransferase [Taibaiella koreensis]|uniref:alpha-1,4-glucan--maltose-1-phosphate maltosyltransferase n=1 Tax=Taibaiella koreensis TaxID=1268548 RepID=UPI000E59CFC9|nr:alpha-1,4-glucan--maltose-1-phosphate maltosyltransferase [Taibaiella koreensis]